jgi:hypothetical protein
LTTHLPALLTCSLQTLLKGRTDALLEVFKRFGTVDKVLPFWEKKHAFVLFTSEASASAAYNDLKNYEKRKEVRFYFAPYAQSTRC